MTTLLTILVDFKYILHIIETILYTLLCSSKMMKNDYWFEIFVEMQCKIFCHIISYATRQKSFVFTTSSSGWCWMCFSNNKFACLRLYNWVTKYYFAPAVIVYFIVCSIQRKGVGLGARAIKLVLEPCIYSKLGTSNLY